MNQNALESLASAYEARLSDHVIEYGGEKITTVKKAFQRLAKKTNITVSPHVLRHSSAVWMAQAGVPMSKIAQFLGHTKTAVTETYYARYSPTYMRDASEATNF
jgi:integrase